MKHGKDRHRTEFLVNLGNYSRTDLINRRGGFSLPYFHCQVAKSEFYPCRTFTACPKYFGYFIILFLTGIVLLLCYWTSNDLVIHLNVFPDYAVVTLKFFNEKGFNYESEPLFKSRKRPRTSETQDIVVKKYF